MKAIAFLVRIDVWQKRIDQIRVQNKWTFLVVTVQIALFQQKLQLLVEITRLQRYEYPFIDGILVVVQKVNLFFDRFHLIFDEQELVARGLARIHFLVIVRHCFDKCFVYERPQLTYKLIVQFIVVYFVWYLLHVQWRLHGRREAFDFKIILYYWVDILCKYIDQSGEIVPVFTFCTVK